MNDGIKHSLSMLSTRCYLHYLKRTLQWRGITSALLSQVIKGKVVRVAVGDTISLLDSANNQIRIRLYGIDCPESKQDFGNVAKKFTTDYCFSKDVSVEVKDIDRFNRTVGIVWIKDTINLELLKAGLAWHYKHFVKSKEGV